jgi:SAM-dependent methyltransferase
MKIFQKCRFCSAELKIPFADLGMSPLANSYLAPEQLNEMEPFYPLRVFVCEKCFLVQAQEFEAPEHIFSDYAYFSSYSESWLAHARSYTEMAVKRLALNQQSRVLEIASNDGYLLQFFVERKIPVLGIEPAKNVADVAIKKGIPTTVGFFGTAMAKELVAQGNSADLAIGNNVLAHVPRLNDFVEGLKIVLKPGGVITMEFPHLMRLVAENQFDTIYHEHFSYFSLVAVEQVFARHGLRIYDVEELPTHGGSLRIYVRHEDDRSKPATERLKELREREIHAGFTRIETYSNFSENIKETKYRLLEFLLSAQRSHESVVAYGAPAKGNTLLNYCGIRSDWIEYTVDRSPHKQGKYLPGTHIPIYSPDRIQETKPAFLLILPWNLSKEIMEQMAHIRAWGGRFVIPIPEVKIV